ncbi:16S rRNA (guanine(527)-N(7))-methyltransferase RsmG [Peptostreptococcus porci]|uniref:16S rRNA (guanine(527)-N(7))-methyltransferase RsmG n=1 Tax=Peptostreptococcus porci TaxID=2652282 RepID=UPI0023F0F58F|nr:16S rRNA (guanine(527)-N(7))-methyltransferase RsmG [Peptostreptococcus porci]MDD7182616.1 16S rRNA (guanine(527)-N(7))-methyltransferase RsmG [Peptostreptococcus porci]MDY5964094.1 16S rRNA (guanine(527)-N(7))-methyltransferase RsmG [Peptostreptococcus porci]
MNRENIELLENGLKNFNIDVNDTMLEKFEKYREILVEYNKNMNLTGITEQREVYIKHFLDSVAIFKDGYIMDGLSVIDVGTGAGFPGIPYKICNPTIKLTLLDSLNKRINFLKDVCTNIGFDDVEFVHGRAEDFGQNEDFREKFDIATARAVANLPVLLELCIPFVKVGGFFICLKGPNAENEVEEAKNAMDVLDVKLVENIEVSLPDEELKHRILVFKKIKETPGKYPRKAGKLSKKPL